VTSSSLSPSKSGDPTDFVELSFQERGGHFEISFPERGALLQFIEYSFFFQECRALVELYSFQERKFVEPSFGLMCVVVVVVVAVVVDPFEQHIFMW
jgi:hypothetical protein